MMKVSDFKETIPNRNGRWYVDFTGLEPASHFDSGIRQLNNDASQYTEDEELRDFILELVKEIERLQTDRPVK